MRTIAVATCLAVLLAAPLAQAQDQTQDVAAPPPVTAPPPQTSPPPAAAPVVVSSGQKENGFVLEVDLGTQLVNVGGVATLDALNGGFFAGVKMGKLELGLGVDFSRVHQGRMGAGDTSTTAVVIMPGLRYTFVSSDDQRVDLFGELDIGLGHQFTDPDQNDIVLRYVVGPGVRFWLHPQFALAALTGLAGNFVWTNGPWSMNDVHSIFASLQLIGVF